MTFRHLFLTSALSTLALFAFPAIAQVEISDARTEGVATSTADNSSASDVTITDTGTITLESGTGITVDSDNSATNTGTINSTDNDNVTGILVDGARTGTVTNNGAITFEITQPTDGILPDGDIATGSGRVGILISGAGPFTGNIENAVTGSISVQGQDSAGIRLASGASIVGDLIQNGSLQVFGERNIGIDVLGNVVGNLAMAGTLNVIGEDAVGMNIAGDIDGGVTVNGITNTTGFVTPAGTAVTTRPFGTNRAIFLEEANASQVGSAMQVSGNISQGIHFRENISDTGLITSAGGINMYGSAPAVLINGDGTPIAIGRVGQITDPDDEEYDKETLYSFVNQGTLISDALFDDLDATTFSLQDAELTEGLNNTQTMRATVYRSGVDPDATGPTPDSHARVIVIGGGGIANRINNSGTILARGFEATDLVYEDPDAIQTANSIFATAIEIDADGSLSEITNLGTITAVITARDGTAIAIRDASGSLISLNNSGNIIASAINSDPNADEATKFTTIALDVSANTSGFTLTQSLYDDPDVEDDVAPVLFGSVLLGSGDDTVDVSSGSIAGNIAFGDGADTLAISNGANVIGSITDTDGNLEIMVTDASTLTITDSADIDVTNATFGAESTYSPFIDPTTGEVSVLNASGTATFVDGVQIDPRLNTILNADSATFTIANAGTLNIDADIEGLRGAASPFLYNTQFTRDPSNPNTLIMTLDLRSTDQLGLDTQQALAFNSAFEALQNSDGLGNAFVGLTDETSFNQAYNQLMPEIAASIRHFVSANIDGATGAVSSHLKNARRSQERQGGIWIEEFTYYADKELAGLSDQFRGYGFGFTGGFDSSFGPFHTTGINIGFATTEIEDVLGVDEPLDVFTVQTGLYAGYEAGNLGIDLYAGLGYNDFESNRRVAIGSYDATTNGDWSGLHYNTSINAGYDINFGGKYFVRPSASASYLQLKEKGYEETGSSDIALILEDRDSSLGTATAMLEFGARFSNERSWWAPSLHIGYRNDFDSDGIITLGRFANGTEPIAITSEVFPESGMLLGFSIAAGSTYSSFSLDYDADLRDGFTRHTARVVLRLIF